MEDKIFESMFYFRERSFWLCQSLWNLLNVIENQSQTKLYILFRGKIWKLIKYCYNSKIIQYFPSGFTQIVELFPPDIKISQRQPTWKGTSLDIEINICFNFIKNFRVTFTKTLPQFLRITNTILKAILFTKLTHFY